MGITKTQGRYYWVKRIPKRFLGIVKGKDGQPVKQARQCLFTDSRAEAIAKGAQVEAAKLAEWEALAAGRKQDARRHYLAARKLAELQGFTYKSAEALLTGDVEDLVRRVLSLEDDRGHLAPPETVAAVLGTVPEAWPCITEVLDEYFTLTAERHLKKSPAQLKRYKNGRHKAVRHLMVALGHAKPDGTVTKPLPINVIDRRAALTFRDMWQARVMAGLAAETANKEFGILSEVWATWTTFKEAELPNPFRGLALKSVQNRPPRPSFSPGWIKGRILVDGALDALNDEARDIFLALINTGLRPSEITDARPEAFRLTADIPHLAVTEDGRELKVRHTSREIPLLGVSLDAARRIMQRGGISRYPHKASNWSALVNKYLLNNDLKEGPDHTAYSLRHSVEDRLLAAGIDDRIRADILGHKYDRPRYGDAGALAGRAEALGRIAL